MEAWKKLYLARKYYIEINFQKPDGNYVTYGYRNGTWMLDSELQALQDAGQITNAMRYRAASPLWSRTRLRIFHRLLC